jgi:hypothetical protein
MVSTSTNINLSPQTIEHKKDHNIWHWKSRSWLGTGKKCGRVKPVNGISTPPHVIIGSPTVIQI